MAQYYWAATADKVGTGVPAGFTDRFVTSGITYAIEADATSPTGYRLRLTLSATGRRLLSLNAVDSDSDRATVKIRALVKSQTGTTTASSYAGVGARASGSAGAGFAVTAPLRRGDGGGSNRSVGLQIMDNDTLETADFYGTAAWSADTYVWIGLDLDGTGYDVLTSNDAGATTRASGSGTVDITGAGWVGIWSFSGNADPYDVAVLTIATGSSPAFYDEPSENFNADAGSFTLTGGAVDFSYESSVNEFNADAGSFTLTGGTVTFSAADPVKGVRVRLYDGSADVGAITGISALVWAATDPDATAADFYTATASTDSSGWLELNLNAVGTVDIDDNVYVIAWKRDGTDVEDSLGWQGVIPVVDIA